MPNEHSQMRQAAMYLIAVIACRRLAPSAGSSQVVGVAACDVEGDQRHI